MHISTNLEKIEEVLERGVDNIYPSKEALKGVLMSGKRLKIYNGIDPTGKLHLGHAVVLRKLRQFQDLGHDVIVLIGDFTATIGDPTGKLSARKKLTRKEVDQNAANYKKLISKILDLNKSNIRFLRNEAWTNKLKPQDMLELASNFTVSRLLERDMFQNRIKEGKEVYLHEFMYPVFQAYDSVTMDVDMEIGGSDQTFNMLQGRTLMRKIKNKEKYVLTTRLLTDPSGKKMGKTEGNLISLDADPADLFGKIMSWPDELLGAGLELLTAMPIAEVKSNLDKIERKEINPRDIKKTLAKEIVKQFHSLNVAEDAEKEFEKIFEKNDLPTEIPVFKLAGGKYDILDLLVKTQLASSKSEAKRLVLQGGVRIGGEEQKDWQRLIETKKDLILQVGKRKFAKII